jgi:hypothetical protein
MTGSKKWPFWQCCGSGSGKIIPISTTLHFGRITFSGDKKKFEAGEKVLNICWH